VITEDSIMDCVTFREMMREKLNHQRSSHYSKTLLSLQESVSQTPAVLVPFIAGLATYLDRSRVDEINKHFRSTEDDKGRCKERISALQSIVHTLEALIPESRKEIFNNARREYCGIDE
jgi:hypothetical protein